MENQYATVVLRKNTKSKTTMSSQAIRNGQRTGTVETQATYGGASNNKGGCKNAAKLDDNEQADFKQVTVTLEFKIALQKARQAKGWNQKELAQKINVKPTVINDYEAGRATPDNGIISKLNRILNVKLPKCPKKKKVKD